MASRRESSLLKVRGRSRMSCASTAVTQAIKYGQFPVTGGSSGSLSKNSVALSALSLKSPCLRSLAQCASREFGERPSGRNPGSQRRLRRSSREGDRPVGDRWLEPLLKQGYRVTKFELPPMGRERPGDQFIFGES